MELRVLRYFLMIVNERNISRAASKLHVSQPTISRQIHNLEQELGVTLFERDTRPIKLTDDGEYLANQAQQLLTLANKTIANISQNHDISGSIFIGCAEAPMISPLADALNQLKKIAPRVKVNLHSCDANEVRLKMQNGIFDFGFVMEPCDKTDYNFLKLPGTSSWGILTRRDSKLAHQASIKPEYLQNQAILMPNQQGSRNLLVDWLGSSSYNFQVVANYNLLNNAAVLVSRGVGHALCLDGIVNTADTNLIFIPLNPRLSAHSSLLWPKTIQLSRAAKAFLYQLKQILPPN